MLPECTLEILTFWGSGPAPPRKATTPTSISVLALKHCVWAERSPCQSLDPGRRHLGAWPPWGGAPPWQVQKLCFWHPFPDYPGASMNPPRAELPSAAPADGNVTNAADTYSFVQR